MEQETHPGGGSPALDWTSVWEDDVDEAGHAAVAALLAMAFPRSRTLSGGERSWSSARPELRVIGRESGRPVAHAGILRRFLQIDGHAQLVGDVGLVGVEPLRQGSGVGAELLARTGAALAALGLPFGYLTCGEPVAGFYARGGWVRVPGPTRMIRADGRVQVYGAVSMVLPVSAPIERWPAGLVDRNGWEV